MYLCGIQSDQLYTWSDEYPERAYRRFTKTPQRASAPTAPAPSRPARLPHRALQTVWQARMQMRPRPRPWSQVLSVGELSGSAATNGLCPAGVARSNRRVHCQLPPSPRDFRSDLRDQPRAAAPPGSALNGIYERTALRPPFTNRCWTGWRACRQYARSLACRQPGRCVRRGGGQ